MHIVLRITLTVAAITLAACGEQVTPIEFAHRMNDACQKALPQAERPTPTWRVCGKIAWCFYCADDHGVLVPVRMSCTETGKRSIDDGNSTVRPKVCDQD